MLITLLIISAIAASYKAQSIDVTTCKCVHDVLDFSGTYYLDNYDKTTSSINFDDCLKIAADKFKKCRNLPNEQIEACKQEASDYEYNQCDLAATLQDEETNVQVLTALSDDVHRYLLDCGIDESQAGTKEGYSVGPLKDSSNGRILFYSNFISQKFELGFSYQNECPYRFPPYRSSTKPTRDDNVSTDVDDEKCKTTKTYCDSDAGTCSGRLCEENVCGSNLDVIPNCVGALTCKESKLRSGCGCIRKNRECDRACMDYNNLKSRCSSISTANDIKTTLDVACDASLLTAIAVGLALVPGVNVAVEATIASIAATCAAAEIASAVLTLPLDNLSTLCTGLDVVTAGEYDYCTATPNNKRQSNICVKIHDTSTNLMEKYRSCYNLDKSVETDLSQYCDLIQDVGDNYSKLKGVCSKVKEPTESQRVLSNKIGKKSIQA